MTINKNSIATFIGLIWCFLFAVNFGLHAQLVTVDDFEDGNDDGWSIVSGEWSVFEGKYHQTDPDYDNGGVTPYGLDMITLAGQVESNSYVAEVSTSQLDTESGWRGIIFRYQDNSNYETMLYYSYRSYIYIEYWTFIGARWSLVDGSVSVDGFPSDPHRLTLQVDGNSLDVYHDGSFVASFIDETGVSSGGIGLYTENQKGAFDNWLLSGIPVSTIEELQELVERVNLSNGISNSLDAKLDAIKNALNDMNENNDASACNCLEAFINTVEAQAGKAVAELEANQLILSALVIQNTLGCTN